MADDFAASLSTTGRLGYAYGSYVTVNIEVSGDQDWFRTYMTAGRQVWFHAEGTDTNRGTNTDPYIRGIYNSSGVLQPNSSNDDAGVHYNAIVGFTAPTNGYYYISGGAFSSRTGTYTLSTSSSSSTTTATSALRISPVSANKNEGNSGATRFTFAVSRSGSTAGSSSVSWAVAGAASANDFYAGVLPSGTVSFAGGQTTKTIAVNVRGDRQVEGDETFSVTLSNPSGASISTSRTWGTIRNDDILLAANVFRTEGGGELEVGKVRVLADFAKAAYYLNSWERVAGRNGVINNVSSYSYSALTQVRDQGWTPVSLSPVMDSTSIIDGGVTVDNRMTNGFYTYKNAAAFVARSNDSLVISFRGTNDTGPGDSPDVEDWYNMSRHYDLMRPLVSALNTYVQANNISNVYVTGHSLGGGMATKFMDDHANGDYGANYEAVSFAAVSYSANGFNDNRITLLEVEGDVVPDIRGGDNGQTFHFVSNTGTPGSNTDYHSMDLYRQITDSIDPTSWKTMLSQSGDQDVLLGITRYPDEDNSTDFLVDGRRSGTNAVLTEGNDTCSDILGNDYDIYYGGRGNDTLTGGSDKEIMLGGEGSDFLQGKGGTDRLYGGSGRDYLYGGNGYDSLSGGDGWDQFKFIKANETRDVITDFESGKDKIVVQSNNFENLGIGNLTSSRFVASANPAPLDGNAVFRYNTSTGSLYFDKNGTGWGGASLIAILSGNKTLVASDITVVSAA